MHLHHANYTYSVSRVHKRFIFTARCVCIAQTMLSQDVCLSVTRRYCIETAKHNIKLFSRPGEYTILFFHAKLYSNIRTGIDCRWGMKYRDF